ncbi:MAG: hypothetical protein PHI40_08350, partial [Caldisericia bacterium]|nr:hypothetical protein [Caldisericia bacterium]
AAASTEDWEAIVQAHQQELPLSQQEGPTLLLASLGQPTSEDWFETAFTHPYRIPLRWPYSDMFGGQGFLDSWRLTHYNAETAPGFTWEYTSTDNNKYAERIDYIYTQGLLPLATETVPMGPWEMMNEQRSAITGTFIVP